MQKLPKQINLKDKKQFRIIPSVYPPINFFEDLVDPAEMETLWEIETLTNERLRQEAGDVFLVKSADRVSGPGATVVMAAFTHIHRPSRFTDGSFGIYYAGLSRETAIIETVYHRALFLRATQEDACELTMRVYEGKILKPFHDLRSPTFKKFHHASEYSHSQAYGRQLRDLDSWGLLYNSVRHPDGLCIAALRPPAISIPTPTSLLRYAWNGEKITEVFDTKSLMQFENGS
jgi:hypothetical protein